jgi:serine/threonine-protein kinase
VPLSETEPELDLVDAHAERARVAREALVGTTIAGRYVLRGLLGHGGMGAVYEAEHLGLGKRAAIKFVDAEFATDEQVVARFAREARAMSAVESAHIVTVFDVGTEAGRPYLVMELLRGEDLGQRLRRTARLPLGEAMHVVAQVLKGLARAHAAGIIHRDLKPDNVFLVRHDTDPMFAKIVDFGVSKIERPRAGTHPLALTGRGTVLGTPFYMSPEQAQASADVDARSDLYSVGAILFECLTGRPPHTGESYEQVMLSICMRDAPAVRALDPSIPEGVSAFVSRALARDPVQRFTSAERMLAALHAVAPEERARVPLDAAAGGTLLSPGADLATTVLDGGAHAPSRPSDKPSAATRVGRGEPAEPVEPPAPDGPAREDDARPGAVAGRSSPAPAPGARARARGDRPPRKASPAKRPLGAAVATAAIATLTGVGVTFLVIAMVGKPRRELDRPVAATVAAPGPARASVDPGASPGEAPSAAASAPSPSSPSASTAPPPPEISARAAAPTSSSKPPASTPTRQGKPAAPSLPGSSSSPLDIQRDLP